MSCGAVRCGVVWCGVVWCGVVWCGVVYLHVAQHAAAGGIRATATADSIYCDSMFADSVPPVRMLGDELEKASAGLEAAARGGGGWGGAHPRAQQRLAGRQIAVVVEEARVPSWSSCGGRWWLSNSARRLKSTCAPSVPARWAVAATPRRARGVHDIGTCRCKVCAAATGLGRCGVPAERRDDDADSAELLLAADLPLHPGVRLLRGAGW